MSNDDLRALKPSRDTTALRLAAEPRGAGNRPLADEQQLKAIGRLARMVQGVVDELREGMAARPNNPGPWFAGAYDRSHRTIFIDGPRGTGKTAVMLTFIHALASDDLSPDERESPVGKRLKQLAGSAKVLPPIDFDPLPDHWHTLAWLVQGVYPMVRSACAGPQSGTSGVESIDELWQRVFKGALSGWVLAGDGRELDEIVLDHLDGQRDWQRFKDDWHQLINHLLESNGVNHEQVVILPVDDADLRPGRSRELLLALRLCWHPRLVFLLTGDTREMASSLRDRFIGRMREISRSGQVEENGHQARSQGLALDLVSKVLPEAQRVEMRLRDWKGLLTWDDGDVPRWSLSSEKGSVGAADEIGLRIRDRVQLEEMIEAADHGWPVEGTGAAESSVLRKLAAGLYEAQLASPVFDANLTLVESVLTRWGGDTRSDQLRLDQSASTGIVRVQVDPTQLGVVWREPSRDSLLQGSQAEFRRELDADRLLVALWRSGVIARPLVERSDTHLRDGEVAAAVELPSGRRLLCELPDAMRGPPVEGEGNALSDLLVDVPLDEQLERLRAAKSGVRISHYRLKIRESDHGLLAELQLPHVDQHADEETPSDREDRRLDRELIPLALPEVGLSARVRAAILYAVGRRLRQIGRQTASDRNTGTYRKPSVLARAVRRGYVVDQAQSRTGWTLFDWRLEDVESELQELDEVVQGPWMLRDCFVVQNWVQWPGLPSSVSQQPASDVLGTQYLVRRTGRGVHLHRLFGWKLDNVGWGSVCFSPTRRFADALCEAYIGGQRGPLTQWLMTLTRMSRDGFSRGQGFNGPRALAAVWTAADDSLAPPPDGVDAPSVDSSERFVWWRGLDDRVRPVASTALQCGVGAVIHSYDWVYGNRRPDPRDCFRLASQSMAADSGYAQNLATLPRPVVASRAGSPGADLVAPQLSAWVDLADLIHFMSDVVAPDAQEQLAQGATERAVRLFIFLNVVHFGVGAIRQERPTQVQRAPVQSWGGAEWVEKMMKRVASMETGKGNTKLRVAQDVAS